MLGDGPHPPRSAYIVVIRVYNKGMNWLFESLTWSHALLIGGALVIVGGIIALDQWRQRRRDKK